MSKKTKSSVNQHSDQTLDEGLDDSILDVDRLDEEEMGQRAYDRTVIEAIDEQVRAPSQSPSLFNAKVTLPSSGVFKHLSPVVKKRLLLVGRRIQFAPGVALNSVGDSCQGLSFILGGRVKVEWMDALSWVPIATLTPGDVLGAMEWAEGQVWEERITAETEALVLFIPTAVLNPLSATYPDLQRQVERYTERHTLHALLGSNALFQGIGDESLMQLIEIATLRYLDPGVILYNPRMVISHLFVIGRGEVELLCSDRVVQVLGRGELANLELALGDGLNLITARVLQPATLYVLPFDQIEFLLAEHNRLHHLQTEAQLLRARALNQ